MDINAGYANDNIQAIEHILPSGDEAEVIDQEGGDLLVFEGLRDDLAQAMESCCIDPPVQTDHIEIQMAHWEQQMEILIRAYLTY